MPIIAFCGIDGCGKTTQLDLLLAWMQRRRVPVQTARPMQPDSPFFACLTHLEEAARRRGDVFPMELCARLMAFEAAKTINTKIAPLSEQGSFVLCDRYLLSQYAYAEAYGLPNEE